MWYYLHTRRSGVYSVDADGWVHRGRTPQAQRVGMMIGYLDFEHRGDFEMIAGQNEYWERIIKSGSPEEMMLLLRHMVPAAPSGDVYGAYVVTTGVKQRKSEGLLIVEPDVAALCVLPSLGDEGVTASGGSRFSLDEVVRRNYEFLMLKRAASPMLI